MGNSQSGASKFSYLDLLASIGSAKHIGGRQATDILIRESEIEPDHLVLDVGCGMGKTSCRLAQEIGCKVVGLDIMPQMIKESRLRAKKMGVSDKVSFIRSDAKSLPLKSDVFDSVIIESVTVFTDDVTKAMDEYYRVAKKGGSICDNEVCVTRESMEKLGDKQKDLESVFSAFGSTTDRGVLTFEDWKDMYKARFGDVKASHHIIDMMVETQTRSEDGLKTLWAQLKAMWLYSTNPEAQRIMDEGKKMVNFKDHFGYGLFICKK